MYLLQSYLFWIYSRFGDFKAFGQNNYSNLCVIYIYIYIYIYMRPLYSFRHYIFHHFTNLHQSTFYINLFSTSKEFQLPSSFLSFILFILLVVDGFFPWDEQGFLVEQRLIDDRFVRIDA